VFENRAAGQLDKAKPRRLPLPIIHNETIMSRSAPQIGLRRPQKLNTDKKRDSNYNYYTVPARSVPKYLRLLFRTRYEAQSSKRAMAEFG